MRSFLLVFRSYDKLNHLLQNTLSARSSIVIPSNSNTFSDWRRTCHVPLVKTQWRPRETTPWTLDDQVVHLETAGNLCTGRRPDRLDVKSHWSRTFLIRDGNHYSRKGIYSRKNISCRLTKGKIWTFVVSRLVVWRQKWVAHVRQLARRSWSPGRKVFVQFTSNYAVPDQIKLKMVELSVRRGQSNFSTVYIFC